MRAIKQFYRLSHLVRAALFIGAMTTGTVAFAAPPLIQTGSFDDLHPAPQLSQLCGLPLVVRESGDFRDVIHVDNTGGFVMESLTFQHYTVTVTNFANGVSLTSPAAGLIRFTQDDAFSAGLVTHFVIPGGGSLTVDAGRIYFRSDGAIVLSGNFDVRRGDVQPLCEALAGS
jgi:hypothetical protein